MMSKLDKAIQEIHALTARIVIKELAKLVVLYLHARANKGLKRKKLETMAIFAVTKLSNSTREVLEAALEEGV